MFIASLTRSLFAPLTSFGGRMATGTALLLVMMSAASEQGHATRTPRPLTGTDKVFVNTEARAEWSATTPARKPLTAFRASELAAEIGSLLSTAERP